jgi:hypothetical protein
MSPNDLLDQLEHNPLKHNIARQLILHAENEKVSNLTYLPFLRIKQISGDDNDALILDTILFMINSNCIYEKRWEFIDQDEEAHEIDFESVIQARSNNTFRHPQTNEIIEDFSKRMSMYFTIKHSFKTNRIKSSGDVVGS